MFVDDYDWDCVFMNNVRQKARGGREGERDRDRVTETEQKRDRQTGTERQT